MPRCCKAWMVLMMNTNIVGSRTCGESHGTMLDKSLGYERIIKEFHIIREHPMVANHINIV